MLIDKVMQAREASLAELKRRRVVRDETDRYTGTPIRECERTGHARYWWEPVDKMVRTGDGIPYANQKPSAGALFGAKV